MSTYKLIFFLWIFFMGIPYVWSAKEITREYSSEFFEPNIILMSGPAMLFYSTYGAGFGINTGIGVKVSSDLYVGADLGVGFLGDVSLITVTATDYSINSINNTGATLIPILPTIFYRPAIAQSSIMRGYIGVSMGPAIHIQSIPSSTTTTANTTKIYFELLIRPGIELSVSKQVGFLFETKFGILRTAFFFIPQLNVTIGF